MSGPIPTRPRMFRWLPLAALAALLLVMAACARNSGTNATSSESAESEAAASQSEAEASPSEAAGESYEITVSDTSAGQTLASNGGMTLYTFDNDSNGQSACSGGCVENWPPFTLEDGEEATAGEGVTGEIGSITREDGAKQVTYDGSPLYYYAGDQAAGDANGDGVGGVWHIATP
jgi:predicted lipoprotein with Yx(FWY)xxD motif